MSAVKTVDESVTSSASTPPFQNDDAIFLPIDGGKTYRFEADLFFEGPSGVGIGFKWTFPSGVQMRYHREGIDVSGTITVGTVSTENSNPTFATVGAGSQRAVRMTGTVFGGGVDGTLQLQWAPLGPSSTATMVHIGSRLNMWADD